MNLVNLFLIVLFSIKLALADETCPSKCDPNASCQFYDSQNANCCKCNEGFNGNGQFCYQNDQSITVRGTLKGNLNGFDLNELEVHVYVHTQATDARNYIAIGSVPPEIGNKISLLLPFATPIHWLFAGDVNGNALNGFSLTGGVFNRQSDSTYLNEQGDVIGNLYVQQNFTGLETGRELRFDTIVEGNLPEMGQDEQVIYSDYNQDYQYSSNIENPENRKLVEAKGSIQYKLSTVRNSNLFKNFRIEHNERIHFSVCDGLIEEKQINSSALTKLITKRLQVTYTQSEGQTRFSSANFLKSSEDQTPNPCDTNECSVFAECIVETDNSNGYYCQCKPGFEGDGNTCTDVNECDEGTAYCAQLAQCYNLLGHYECKCLPPHVGDGRDCQYDSSANTYDTCSRCNQNARCIVDESQTSAYCKCNQGFVGNGIDCQQEDLVNDNNNQDRSDESNDNYPPYRTQPPYEQSTTTTVSTSSTRVRLLHTDKCERCNQYATCELQLETGGECCACLDGYVGNGKYCFAEATPVLVTGKVTGLINNEKLEELDFYSYVLTHSSDSRNFVAIGKIPPQLGGSFQTLIHLISPVNWLFAGRNGADSENKISNGFQLTGGLFSRIATITFFDEMNRQSHSIRIRQQFFGLDSESESKEININTELDGSLPDIDPDAQVVFRDYKQEYTHYARGAVRSFGELNYEVTTVKNSRVFTTYRIQFSDELSFSECPHLPDRGSTTVRINSKRVYVRYTKGDGLVRFTSANFIHSQESTEDPCEVNSCSIYAECVADYDAPNNYSCICKVGFEGDGFNCDDLDECQAGEADCDPNAVCYNLVGHYECRCKSPYKGNGKECSYDLDCRSCDLNARCVEFEGQKKCICNDGYFGDGFGCNPIQMDCSCGENAYCTTNYLTRKPECKCKQGFHEDYQKQCKPLPCNEYFNCNQNARCELNQKGDYTCKCLPGFHGDGIVCTTQTCDVLNNCGDNARCEPDSLTLQYRCLCDNGYIGNGYDCVKDNLSCNVLKNCHPNAECLLEERTNRHFCKCKPGYAGDGHQCGPINSCRNKSPYEVCDINADCVFDSKVNEYICKCKPGYEGNGLRSKCVIDESIGRFLVYAQGSSLHKIPLLRTLEDENPLVHKNRIVYIPGQTAIGLSYDCHEKYIYWSDVSSNTINRIREDGSNFSVILNNVKSAEGLAVDWISRNIYFTDSESRTIEVASLNGLYRKVLIRSHLTNPRGIAVDPIDGYIYWTDWNRKHPKIERSNMDGSHRKVIVGEDLGVPNGLYFDQKRQEICWGDAKTKRIECVEKDGSNRRIVTQMNQMYPFDLTEVRSNIYWSDWSKKELQNVDKDGVIGQPLKLSPGGYGRIYGIVAIKSSCPKGTNACDRTNGDCSQLCLPKPDHTRQCACSDESNSDCLKTLTIH